jgi:hypothetical protein
MCSRFVGASAARDSDSASRAFAGRDKAASKANTLVNNAKVRDACPTVETVSAAVRDSFGAGRHVLGELLIAARERHGLKRTGAIAKRGRIQCSVRRLSEEMVAASASWSEGPV